MVENNKTYRLKCNKEQDEYLKLNITQDFDILNVLSLKITQEDTYKLYTSNYGVVVGRVLANDGFGVPNAKISIFIANMANDGVTDTNILYPYKSTSDKNNDGIRYNLLPDNKKFGCYQNVGTFSSKLDMLDNDTELNNYNDFYTLTTTTNEAGDYMFFGVPTGSQQIHVDIDLSDIGILSQTPRDMMYKGYSIKSFESPNKFKKSTNLDSLPQIISQDTTVFVYPFWGDETQGDIAISKKNINIQYKFEPTCVFMGSVFTDSVKSGISKNCKPYKTSGKMSELMASQGLIEMIRKTQDGDIERFDINGGRVINSDGVWCYQIPMNLDYMITDEYGNLIPTDDPTIGIPTRTNVRFRVTLDGNSDSFVQSKTASYLIPNNPKTEVDEDYEFGKSTKNSSFTDLFWNKVYSVKNYIPRLQTTSKSSTRKFLGIKSTNYHENNNPAPYNKIYIDLNLKFKILCILTKLFVNAIALINQWVITPLNKYILKDEKELGYIIISKDIFGDCSLLPSRYDDMEYFVPMIKGARMVNREYFGITLLNAYNDKTGEDRERAEGNVGVNEDNGTLWVDSYKVGKDQTNPKYNVKVFFGYPGDENSYPYALFLGGYKGILFDCMETNLSESSEVVNFDFTNDWVNGAMYMPRFLTKTRVKRRTGERVVKFCGYKTAYNKIKLVNTCAVAINTTPALAVGVDNANTDCIKGECYKQNSLISTGFGNIIYRKDEGNFIYRSNFVNNGNNTYYHPTDVILIGGLNDFDNDGIPKLHQLLPPTSFKVPDDLAETEEGEDVQTPIFERTGVTFLRGHTRIDTSYSLEKPTYIDSKPITGDTSVIYEEFNKEDIIIGYYKWVAGTTNNYELIDKANYLIEHIGIVGYTNTVNSGELLSSGIDWSNDNKKISNGLFVSIGCLNSTTLLKTCVNAERLCEIGVDFDEKYDFENYYGGSQTILPNGFISIDEISDGDSRGMFATLNSNHLTTIDNQHGLKKYIFNYIYPNGFDGKLNVNLLYDSKLKIEGNTNYLDGDWKNVDYNNFRFSSTEGKSYTYDTNYKFPRYENSLYFYFGLKQGSTALDLFNSQYYVPCKYDVDKVDFNIKLLIINKESICPGIDGEIQLNIIGNIALPYVIYVNEQIFSSNNQQLSVTLNNLESGYKNIKIVDYNADSVVQNIFLPMKNGITFETEITNSLGSHYGGLTGSVIIKNIENENSGLNAYKLTLQYKKLINSNWEYQDTSDILYFTGVTYAFNNLGYSFGSNYILNLEEQNCLDNLKQLMFNIDSNPAVQIGSVFNIRLDSFSLYDNTIIHDGGGSLVNWGVFVSKTNQFPTESDNEVNSFVTTSGAIVNGVKYNVGVNGLKGGTNYYVRCFAENNIGVSYSEVMEVTTNSNIPLIETDTPTNVTTTGATFGGINLHDNGSDIIEKGVFITRNSNIGSIGEGTEYLDTIITENNVLVSVKYDTYNWTIENPTGLAWLYLNPIESDKLMFWRNWPLDGETFEFNNVWAFYLFITIPNEYIDYNYDMYINTNYNESLSIINNFYVGADYETINLPYKGVYYVPKGQNKGFFAYQTIEHVPYRFLINKTITDGLFKSGSFYFMEVKTENTIGNHNVTKWVNGELEYLTIPFTSATIGYGYDSGDQFIYDGVYTRVNIKQNIAKITLIAPIGVTPTDNFSIQNTESTILASASTFYAQAYAKNSIGIGYGETLAFNTL